MSEERYILAATDAGGARALVGLALELHQRSMPLLGVGSGPAVNIWRAQCAGIPFKEMADGISVEDVCGLLRSEKITTVVTAAGLYNQLEHTLRLAAKHCGLPCASILDSWLNYAERFQRKNGDEIEISWPDLICAIDEITAQGVKDAGFDAAKVVVTGPLNMELSLKTVLEARSHIAEWKNKHQIGLDDKVVFFFSDPFFRSPAGGKFMGSGGLYDDNGVSLFGYDSLTTIDGVLAELKEKTKNQPTIFHVFLKPHPLEHEPFLHAFLTQYTTDTLKVKMAPDKSAAECIAVADVCLGMMTIALLEAALSGVPAISFEVGLQSTSVQDPCLSNTLGYTVPIYSSMAQSKVINNIVGKQWDVISSMAAVTFESRLPVCGAAGRAADVINARLGCLNWI